MRLIEKGPYQALYRADGGIERLLHDRDGDGRADAVVLFDDAGYPVAGEIDTDLDGVVDRWEQLAQDGRVVRVGISEGRSGRPDRWFQPRSGDEASTPVVGR
jgi:hypothetical protein